MPLSGPPLEPLDVPSLLKFGLETKPDEFALVSAESRWTWRALDAAANRLARQFLELGLKPGDRIASLMPNRVELVIHYLACFRAGLVATPLNYRYMPPEIDHALGVSGASAMLAHVERAEDLAKSAKAGDMPLEPIIYGGDLGGAHRLEDLLAREAPASDLPKPDYGAPAFIYFTSGSTGKPKGVTHSLSSTGWVLAAYARSMELTAEDIMLPGSSFSHISVRCCPR